MALPSMATFFDWHLPVTNVILSEEENHQVPLITYEKTIPSTMNVHDFLKFFEESPTGNSFVLTDDSIHLSPFLAVFSPPPEV